MAFGSNLVRSIRVVFEGDAKGFDRASREVEVGGGRIHRSAKKLELLGHVADGLTVLGVSLVGFREGVTGSVQAASDLHEQLNKVDVVFGKSSVKVKDWSRDTATSMGISRAEALTLAGTFGNLLVPMGFARTKAAAMSTSLVHLASDMASFNNSDPSATLRALQSGLAGQVRPLREFGVFLSMDRIKAEAFSDGIAKADVDVTKLKEAQLKLSVAHDKLGEATKKYGKDSQQAQTAQAQFLAAQDRLHKALAGSRGQLTASQKALASYKIIMKDTKDAQGDFARTSDGLANRQRILHAQFKNMQESLGTLLYPIVTRLANTFSHLANLFDEHEKLVKKLAAVIVPLALGLFLFVKAMQLGRVVGAELKAVYSGLGKVLGLFTAETEASTVASEGATEATWGLNAALLANPITLVVVALVALGLGLYEAWQHSATFRRIVTDAFDAVKTAAVAVFNFFRRNWPLIVTLISGPFAPIVALATNAFGVRSGLEGALNSVKNFVRNHWGEIATLISGPFAPIVLLATGAFGVRSALKHALDDIVGFWSNLPSRVGSAVVSHAEAFVKDVEGLFGHLPHAIRKLLGIASPSQVFAEIGENVVRGFIQGIHAIGPALLKKARDLFGSFADAASGAAGWVGGLFHGHGHGGGGGGGGFHASPGEAQLLAQSLMGTYGWGRGQWGALNSLWNRESGWRWNAQNPSSGAYGIPQSLPADKMASFGSDWRDNALTQIAWGLSYIAGRYGSPAGAWAHEQSFGWYGSGGIFTRPTIAGLGERGDEAVIPLSSQALRRYGLGGDTVHVHFEGPVIGSDLRKAAEELAEPIRTALLRQKNRVGSLGLG